MASLTLPPSSRGTWLLCCVALCLLGAGSADVGVTQSPRHLIKGRGGKAVMKCHPISGHKSLLWYQQTQGQGPQFLVEYYEKEEREKGKISEHFSFQLFDDYSSELAKSSLQLEDSAVYFCASSLDTALQGHMDAGITQSPRYKVTGTEKQVTLRCHQTDNHDYMCWYRQDPGHGLRLIHYSVAAGITNEGDVPKGYNVSRSNTQNFPLTLMSASPSQTSVYFCASSDSTVLHGRLLSAQKKSH